MKSNQQLSNDAGYLSRVLMLLSSLFGGKGFIGKIGFILVIAVLLVPNLLISIVFAVLVFGFVAVMAMSKDKEVEKISKKASKGVIPFAKYAINGNIGGSLAKSVGDSFVATTGGKLDVELREQGLSLLQIGNLKKFFSLLKIKDKQALKLAKTDGGVKLLNSYVKTYGSILEFQRKLNKEKAEKKALKKAAKSMKTKVVSVSSWSATSPTP